MSRLRLLRLLELLRTKCRDLLTTHRSVVLTAWLALCVAWGVFSVTPSWSGDHTPVWFRWFFGFCPFVGTLVALWASGKGRRQGQGDRDGQSEQ
jgi:hypothetical protein